MGCDIHIIAEVKEDGVWSKNTEKVFLNPYYEMYKKMRYEEPEKYKQMKKDWGVETCKLVNEPPSGRYYNWFSVLANVRNGFGFAGVKTGEGFEPIALPKGFPKDASLEAMEYLGMKVDDNLTMEDYNKNGGETELENGEYSYSYPREQIEKWGCSYFDEDKKFAQDVDYHSYSYFTAQELSQFDWDGKMTMLRGTVTLEQYKILQKTGGAPQEGWSGAVFGKDMCSIEEDEADKVILKGVENTEYKDKNVYVNYHWMDSYAKLFENYINNTIKPLQKLAMKYEDARIVFAFDN